MRPLILAAVTLFTLAGPASAASPALDYDEARHLLMRTGFGPTEQEVASLVGSTREQAVSRLLAGARTVAVTPAPEWTNDRGPLRYPRQGEGASDMEKKLFQQEQVREGLQLRAWWVSEMLTTSSPLTERMTLFWHNHFVSSQQKVKLARLMYRQNVTLREHALGNFGDMLHALARDPAMVVYLDSVQNRRGAPNENFAREVMELFTLGEGRYGEQDVKEAARAFTGWSLDRNSGDFVFRRFIHDDGDKTVLGRTGNLDGDQVLDILLAQPATSEFIVRKLWREFVSPDPDGAQVARIARHFREARYDIRTALRDVLSADAFYAPQNRGVLVKSPVELVVGTVRQLGLHPTDTMPFAVAAAGMGQNLFSPPNVKGWPGQEAWINAGSLLARKQFVDRLLRSDDNAAPRMVAAGASGSGATPGLSAAGTSESDSMPRMLAAGASASNAAPRISAAGSPTAMAVLPKQALQPLGATDEGKAREIRFMRAMERGVTSLQFDSARWLAQFSGDEDARRDHALRLLLPTEPQSPPRASEPLALLRGVMLDAAYQLK